MSAVGGRRPPLQVLKHDINIDKAVLRMAKRARQSPNNFHPEISPKSHRRFVCRDNEIKLHCAKAEPASFGQTMLAHCATNPLPRASFATINAALATCALRRIGWAATYSPNNLAVFSAVGKALA